MKILIEVKGGTIQRIVTDQEVEKIVIVDWDNASQGNNPVERIEPDSIIEDGNFHLLYSSANPADLEVQQELKRLHL